MAHYVWREEGGRGALWRAVVSVFNLEPGERLCPLCWESSRIHAEGRGGGGGRRSQVWGARVSCLCSRSSTGPSVAAFFFFFCYTKMSLRIYGCDISSEREPLSHNPPPPPPPWFIFVCRNMWSYSAT